MLRMLIDNIQPMRDGQEFTVKGWVDKIRPLKWVIFLVIRDHTGLIQVTIERSAEGAEELVEIAESLTQESTVEVTGIVKANTKVKLKGLEIIPSRIFVHNKAEVPLPLNESSSRQSRMEHRYLSLRSAREQLIFRVQTVALLAMRKFWAQHDFTEMQSPKLMAAASESGAELFQMKYFGQEACLAQSPQFYKQLAIAGGVNRYCEVGPVFRANKSHTSRHDTEFTMIDMEMAWIESHYSVMDMEQAWLQYVLREIDLALGHEIKEDFGVDVVVPELPFPRITMERAHEIVESYGIVIPPENMGDLSPEAERAVAEAIELETGHEFVFITDYPWAIRPFYHMRPKGRPDLTKSFDLLWKGLEVTTGAQREHRHDILHAQAIEKGLDPDTFGFYMNCFRYGCPPHGGFGFGLTRMLMVLLGVENVREVTFLYRGPTWLSP